MAIDPRIALAGQSPNLIERITGGQQLAETLRDSGTRGAILRQNQQLNQQAIQQGQQQQALQAATHTANFLEGLKGVPIEQRAEVVAQQMPVLQKLGLQPQEILSQNLTDQGIDSRLSTLRPLIAKDLGRPFEIDGALVSPTGDVLYQSPATGGVGGSDPTGGKGWENVTRDEQTGIVTGLNKLTNQIEVIPQGEQAQAALESIAERETGAATSQAETAEQERVFSQSSTLRKEYETSVKDAEAKLSAFGAVENVLKADDELLDQFSTNMSAYASDGVDVEKIINDSRAISDIALIFAFFKTVDPTSTVREGEFATVENAGGIPTRFMNMYNNLLKGTRMSDVQRNQIIRIAQNSRNEAARNINRQRDKYRSLSTLQDIDPSLVIMGDDVATDIDLTKEIDLPKQGDTSVSIPVDATTEDIQSWVDQQLSN